MRTTHFSQRCCERGIRETDPDDLFHDIKKAVHRHDRGQKQGFVEFVMAFKDARYWRFTCRDGTFYALTQLDGSLPLTVFTQRMMASRKAAAKAARRNKRFKMASMPGRPVRRRASRRDLA